MSDQLLAQLPWFQSFIESGRAPVWTMGPVDLHGFLTALAMAGPSLAATWQMVNSNASVQTEVDLASAIRKDGTKKGPTIGSGGVRRRGGQPRRRGDRGCRWHRDGGKCR